MLGLSAFTVVGIGAMDKDATIFKGGTLNINDLMYLKLHGVVGDVLSHFLDRDGNLVETANEDRLVSTPLPTLKTLDNVIGVAAGPTKVEAIHAVLLGKYLSVLVTDERQAEEVCAELVHEEGVRSFILCPGFTNQGVGRLSASLGPSISVNVSRGDGPSNAVAHQEMERAGFFKH